MKTVIYTMTNLTKIFCAALCICAVSCANPSRKASEADFVDSVAEALADGGQIRPERLQWTREPAAFEIKDRIPTSGSGPIIIFGTTMPPCCR